jgi:diguanylate cyclase (GGDEF)-like protein
VVVGLWWVQLRLGVRQVVALGMLGVYRWEECQWGVLKFVSSQEADSQRTVAIFDIDGLKAVNDAYGHLVGDIFITEVAGRLARALAPTDLVGRWGGDEFVIVLDVPAARSAPILARAQAAVTCEQIQVRGHRIPVAVSFGVAE